MNARTFVLALACAVVLSSGWYARTFAIDWITPPAAQPPLVPPPGSTLLDYQTGSNWSDGQPPQLPNTYNVSNGATAVLDPLNTSGIIGVVNPATTVQVNQASFGNGAGNSGHFRIHSGTLEIGDGISTGSSFEIGSNGGTATVVHTAGTVRVLRRGQDINVSRGGVTSYTISGGVLEGGRWEAAPNSTYGFRPKNDGSVTGDGYGQGPEYGGDLFIVRDNSPNNVNAVLNVQGGLVRVPEYFYIADLGSADDNGTLNVSGGEVVIGRNLPTHDDRSLGTATINVSAGRLYVDRDLQMNNVDDNNPAPSGLSVMNVTGTGLVEAGDHFVLGGGTGTGRVNQSAGTVRVGVVNFGVDHFLGPGENPNLLIGPNLGDRTYNDKALILGVESGGTGEYNLSGTGTLEVRRVVGVGFSANGVFNQTGGTLNVLAMGTIGNGTYREAEDDDEAWDTVNTTTNLSGWRSTGGDLFVSGDFVDGLRYGVNTSTISNPGDVATPSGTYNLSGGALNTDGNLVVGIQGPGTFRVTGGAATTNIGQGYTDLTGSKEGGIYFGALPENATPLRHVDVTVSGTARLVAEITGPTHTTLRAHGNVVIGPGSTLEAVATSVPATGAHQYTLLQANSDADANGTLSGSFATFTQTSGISQNRKFAVLYEDNSVVLGLARPGDANFDSAVNSTDLTAATAKFNTAMAATWREGDWTGNGAVNSADLLEASPFLNLPYTTAPAANDSGQPTIAYDPATGNFTVDVDGRSLNSYILQSDSGIFTAANPNFIGGTAFQTNTNSEVSENLFNPTLNGVHNLGNIAPPALTLPFLLRDLTLLGGFAGAQNFAFDLVVLPQPSDKSWNINSNGTFSVGANWTGGAAPGGIGDTATFGNVITADRSVTVSQPVTLGILKFDDNNNYTLTGAGPLTLQANGIDDAVIQVQSTNGNGAHSINVPLTIASNLIIAQGSTQPLTIGGPLDADAGRTITKAGAGTLIANRVRTGTLTVNTGSLAIAPNGGDSGTSVVDTLSVNGTGKLDLNNNDLVVRATAATKDAVHGDIEADIVSAQNGLDAALITKWDGPGITSATARAANVMQGFDLTGLGVIRNSDLDVTTGIPNSSYTSFNGQPVTPDDVLVKYTYLGDANLSGAVSFDDYVGMDNAFFGLIPNLGWATGDINFDGVINFDDYSKVDQAFFFQGAPLTREAGVAAVPEPGACLLAALSLISLILVWRRVH